MNTILELKNIHKSYKQKILCGLNYKFHDTGLYVIYGVSGSGKSTLLNIIARFDRPNHGEILLRYRNLEYITQEHMLFTKNVKHPALFFIIQFREATDCRNKPPASRGKARLLRRSSYYSVGEQAPLHFFIILCLFFLKVGTYIM